MAGVPGFEPGDAEIKTRCLTAWRYPNKFLTKLRTLLLLAQLKQPLTFLIMVREERLELSHLTAPEPKSGVSTNSTTPALTSIFHLE